MRHNARHVQSVSASCSHDMAESGSQIGPLTVPQVLDEAAKRNLRLVIALANNWDQDSNADNK
jgi:hypothetical protein